MSAKRTQGLDPKCKCRAEPGRFLFCPMHEAAPALLEAAEIGLKCMPTRWAGCWREGHPEGPCPCHMHQKRRAVETAIAKARGTNERGGRGLHQSARRPVLWTIEALNAIRGAFLAEVKRLGGTLAGASEWLDACAGFARLPDDDGESLAWLCVDSELSNMDPADVSHRRELRDNLAAARASIAAGALGQLGGQATSAAKSAAARKNGKRGGRPRGK